MIFVLQAAIAALRRHRRPPGWGRPVGVACAAAHRGPPILRWSAMRALSVQARWRPDVVVAGALLTRLAPGAILGLIPAASGFASLLGLFVLACLSPQSDSDDRALPRLAPPQAMGTRVPLLYPPVTRAGL